MIRREKEFKEISAKLELTSQQLLDLQKRALASNEEIKRLRERESIWENEKQRLQEALRENETLNTRLELSRKGLDQDAQRLQSLIAEKDEEIKVKYMGENYLFFSNYG